jgi:hypothetical protein
VDGLRLPDWAQNFFDCSGVVALPKSESGEPMLGS